MFLFLTISFPSDYDFNFSSLPSFSSDFYSPLPVSGQQKNFTSTMALNLNTAIKSSGPALASSRQNVNGFSLKSTSLSFSHCSSVQGFGAQISLESKQRKRFSLLHTEAVRQLTGHLTRSQGLRFAVVVARFNEIVTKALLEGALDTFRKYSVKEEDIDVVWVPGSFEIGIVAERLGKSRKYSAVLCIGAVIRGDTTHYDAVANAAASGIQSAGINSGVPCIFGVLTCEDMDQALNRSGGKSGNKGAECALTAIEMASLFEHHLK